MRRVLGFGGATLFGQRGLGGLQGGRERVRLVHQRNDLILEGGLTGLRHLDFVVERLEFLVGLDRGLVVLELGHPHVDRRDVLFERAPRGAVVVHLGAGGGAGPERGRL